MHFSKQRKKSFALKVSLNKLKSNGISESESIAFTPLCKATRVKYQFILEYSHQFKIKMMCRFFNIARAGYYALSHEPESGRTIEDKQLLQHILSFYDTSYGIYGYRRTKLDLKELGESCGPNRVLKIMKNNDFAPIKRTRVMTVVALKSFYSTIKIESLL
ncbi:hypothetical protein SFB21_1928 [Acinetobacter bouvetii]|uniref:HTH-like domain-containing protein n=1 Tax=Acinetobacter bouvetii TaxID=202951 RepID=A0A811GCB7_9GAMM|nr:hypothetical protein SFB21_1928 [Acinetobacter bouvetii]